MAKKHSSAARNRTAGKKDPRTNPQAPVDGAVMSEDIKSVQRQEDCENIIDFMDGMRPLRGVVYGDSIRDQMESGRSLILKIGRAFDRGDAPTLTAGECADILTFIHCSESPEPLDWYSDEGGPRVSGLMKVLSAIEESLRAMGAQP